MSKKHGMEMFQKGDAPHLEAINKMQTLMQDPNTMGVWFDNKRKEFEGISNNE